MAKIKDVISLKTGYANFVELKSAFEESQENADRMAMYRPTKAHRRAFERITRGLFQPTDKKFYLLSGSYGTGKSHLCLMTANVLSRSSGDPAIAGFYENYAKLDAGAARHLKNIRKDGQYLVAICDYHSGRRFEDVVMKAVFEACAARGLDARVDTEFDEAERRLAAWEQQGNKGGIRNFYQDFTRALASVSPATTVDQLRQALKDYDSHAMEQFRLAFREMMGGIDFQATSGNLIPIIRTLVRSREFKDRFKGLAVFFDEFGFTLEKANYSKDVLQGFMETICKNEPNVLFVGCIHKDFKSYADRFSKADTNVMSARITQVDLLNEGIEEIIAAIVETDKQSPVWINEIAPKTPVFDQLIPPCTSLNLFPWIDDVARMRTRVLEDIYGVHPMALSCLLKLSSEVGSDARSTFTFFTGAEGGVTASYAEFVEQTDITANGGKLSLYTTDLLVTFFRNELSPRNPDLREGQRRIVNGYTASMDALRKGKPDDLLGLEEDERLRILKVILICLLCQIPTSLENIQFGLYCLSSHEKKHTEALLKDLVKYGAVFFRQQSRTYELAAGSGEDPYDLIERFIADPSLHSHDPVQAFLDEAGAKSSGAFLDARGFNLPNTDDKRFRTVYVPAKDLGPELWDELQKDYESHRANPVKSYEGVLVYALCEEEADISVARTAVKSLAWEHLAVSIPHAPIPFRETLLKVRACRHYLSKDAAITAQTESRMRDILDNPQDGFLPQLKKTYTHIVEGGNSCWYTAGGSVLVDKPHQTHRAADMLCERLYTKKSLIKHPDLNQCHDERWKTGKNTALKQAVDVLLNAERVMIDNGNPDNHGEKRYLEKVLLSAVGALKKTGADGRVTYFACESDAAKLTDKLPVFKDLYTKLGKTDPGRSFALGTFLSEVREAPYGAGGTALTLILAHVIRAYGERLTFFKDSTRMVEYPVRTYQDLTAVVSDPASQVVVSVRNISAEQMDLVNRLAVIVGEGELKHGESRSLKSAYQAIMNWYSRVPPVSRIVTLYDPDDRKRLGALKDVFEDEPGRSDHFGLLLERLPNLYRGGTEAAELTGTDVKTVSEGFKRDVAAFESAESIVKGLIAGALCRVFGTDGDMIECEKVMIGWYKGLNSAQREVKRYDDSDTAALALRLGEDKPFVSLLTTTLPADFGFGPVREWTSLRVQDYAAKVEKAKKEIDKAKIRIPVPKIKQPVYEIGSNQSVTVDIPPGSTTLVYTMDGGDPKTSDSEQTTEPLDLATLLKDKPNVKVKIRAVDNEGNYSDAVEIELIDRQHKYDLKITDDLYAAEATFKWPDDVDGLVAVCKSLIKYAVKKSLVTPEAADAVEAVVRKYERKDS